MNISKPDQRGLVDNREDDREDVADHRLHRGGEAWQSIVKRAQRLARQKRLFHVLGVWLREVKRRGSE